MHRAISLVLLIALASCATEAPPALSSQIIPSGEQSLDAFLGSAPRRVKLEQDAQQLLASYGGAAVNRQGELLWADPSEHNVKLYGPDGTLKALIGGPGGGPGEFEFPSYPAFGPDASILVADLGDGAVSKFDRAGTFIGDVSPLPVGAVGGLAVLPHGDLLITGFAMDSQTNVLYHLDGMGQLQRALLPIRDVLPEGSQSNPIWSSLRGFWLAVDPPNAYVTAALSDSLWIANLDTGQIRAHAIISDERPPLRAPPEGSLRNIHGLLDWARQQYIMATPVVANGFIALTFMRGEFLADPEVIQIARDANGVWWRIREGDGIIVAANEHWIVAVRGAADAVEVLYYPRQSAS